eukprot:jgi/Mesvir1/14405/Mv09792-RA.1
MPPTAMQRQFGGNDDAARRPATRSSATLPFFRVQLTLNSLRRPSLDVLYLHGVPAEHRMPLEDALAICNGLIKEGKAQQLGLSNFPAWEVVHIYHICKQNGWALPKVCQVVYNCVQREAEAEIIPALRALGMRCGATDVFAGGLLMDQPHPANAGLIRCQVCPKCFDTKFYRDMHVARRHSKPNSLARVTNESLEPVASPRLSMSKVPDAEGMEATWKDGSIRAQRIIHMSCQRAQLDMRRVALHWLRAHSALRAGDMVLLNCSSSKDLVELLQQWATATKPLPGPLLVALDKGWKTSKGDNPSYFADSL